MSCVTIHEAKTNLSRLIAEVEAGGDVTIWRRKVPVAKLVALSPAKKPNRVPSLYARLGPLPDGFFDPLPKEELAAWEGAFGAQYDALTEKPK
jgi:prevent-host-death family protein